MLISLLVWAYVTALFVLIGRFYFYAARETDAGRDSGLSGSAGFAACATFLFQRRRGER